MNFHHHVVFRFSRSTDYTFLSWTISSTFLWLWYRTSSCKFQSLLIWKIIFFLKEFLVAEDLNKITLQCTYLGHQNRIHAIYFSSHNELLLSVCREKKFNCYSTNPAEDNHQHPRGNYTLSSWAISIAIDELSRQCFVGDATGNIHFLKINTDNKFQLITTLTGHTGKECQSINWSKKCCFRWCSNTFMGSGSGMVIFGKFWFIRCCLGCWSTSRCSIRIKWTFRSNYWNHVW